MSASQGLYRLAQVVWYILYIIETLLLFRFGLRLFGANPAAAFTDLVYSLSAVFLAPFRLVFDSVAVTSESVIEWSTLLAMLVYWVIAWSIVKLIVMQRPVSRREADRELELEDNA